MTKAIDIATACFLGALIGAVLFAFIPRDPPHSDVVSFQIKPATPGRNI